MKRILVRADCHSGHQTGLTPPDWQYRRIKNPANAHLKRRNKFYEIQREAWRWYCDVIKKLQPIDILFEMGDMIDGRGEKSGGTELITTDTNEQNTMAVQSIEQVRAKRIVGVYGSPYHTAPGYADNEDAIADAFGRKFTLGAKEFPDVNGKIFYLKHRVSKTSIPHGQHTLTQKPKLWNLIWAARGMQPKADIAIHAHIHEFNEAQGCLGQVITCPALEWSTKYGSRNFDGYVSMGLISFEIPENKKEVFAWHHHVLELPQMRVKALKL